MKARINFFVYMFAWTCSFGVSGSIAPQSGDNEVYTPKLQLKGESIAEQCGQVVELCAQIERHRKELNVLADYSMTNRQSTARKSLREYRRLIAQLQGISNSLKDSVVSLGKYKDLVQNELIRTKVSPEGSEAVFEDGLYSGWSVIDAFGDGSPTNFNCTISWPRLEAYELVVESSKDQYHVAVHRISDGQNDEIFACRMNDAVALLIKPSVREGKVEGILCKKFDKYKWDEINSIALSENEFFVAFFEGHVLVKNCPTLRKIYP